MDKLIYNIIIQCAIEHEDGTIGLDNCLEYVGSQLKQIAPTIVHTKIDELIEKIQAKEFVDGALNTGIPLSVIKGHTKLTDHFTIDYINSKCNK